MNEHTWSTTMTHTRTAKAINNMFKVEPYETRPATTMTHTRTAKAISNMFKVEPNETRPAQPQRSPHGIH